MTLSAFSRRHTTNHVGTIGYGLLGMKRTLFAGKALADYPGVFIN